MTLTIELPAELETRLNARAKDEGVEPSECARRLIESALPPRAPDQATLDLLARWAARDATDDPAEIARRNRDFEEFKAAINQTREEAGARKVYP